MTSITLISPVNQASTFNVRFRDPIEIKENSKVYLNYASFTRSNSAKFSGNPTINLKSSLIIPTHQLNDATILNDLDITASVNAFSIDENDFILTPQQLEERMNNALRTLCVDKLRDYVPVMPPDVIDLTGDNGFLLAKLGLCYENRGAVDYTEFVDSTNTRGQGTGGNARTKTSASATAPFYDNYSITTDSVFIFQQASSTFDFSKHSDELKRFTFTTNKDLDDLTGKISVGLFSNDMMDHSNAFDGWVNKTKGGAAGNANNYSNPAIFRAGNGDQIKTTDADFDTVKSDGILGSFLTLEIDPATDVLNIYQPRGDSLRLPFEWTHLNQNIQVMETIQIIDLDDTNLDLHQAITTSVIFYMDLDEDEHKKESFKVNFKIYMKNRRDDDELYEEVFNSKNRDAYYPLAFFTGLDVNEGGLNPLQKVARLKSQSPFGLMFSAQEQGEGVLMEYTPYTMDGSLDKPTSLLLEYNFNFSEELSEILDTTKSINLYPNTYKDFTNSLRVFIYSDFRAMLNGLSYDIFLNNLPIKNYKNVEKSSNGGFIKQIIATCPLPFNQKNTTSINKGRIIGLYEPNNPTKLQLDNQKITLNNLDVSIKTSHDERPAFELEKVMINIVVEE